MTEPSQYFKGRTVQEQMNEVIGYVDARSTEVASDVAAAKASEVLEPAEAAKDAAIQAKNDANQAKDDAVQAKNDAQSAQAAAEQAVTDAAAVLANAVKKTGESSQGIAGDIIVAGNLTGGTVTVPTPVNNNNAANKKYVDDADALKVGITDINNYAIGLTGIQNATGTKMFTNGFFDSMKINGAKAYEILRYPVVNEMNIFMQIFSRFGCIAGSLKIETSGGAITDMALSKIVIVSSTLGIFTLYAYIDDNNVVVCVGNRITANNSYSVCILGGCDGTGNSLAPNISNIKTVRNISSATKVDVF